MWFSFFITWEQRKFADLYRKVSRKNDLTFGESDIISVANMYYKEDSYITDDSYLLTYNVFHLGDIAFEGNKSKDFAHGRFVENTIGNGIVSHVFDVFEPIMPRYDLIFWKYAINNERLMGPILVRATKASTMMTNLVAEDFLQEKFLVPSYDEQRLIGQLLLHVDNLITLHQRKQNIMLTFKKCHFYVSVWQHKTTTWEQRKLKQVATIQKGEQLSKAKLDSVGKYYVLNGGMGPSGFCDDYNTEPNTISISEGGNSCGYVALNIDRFWSGGHNYTLQNLRIDTEFLFQYLKGIETKIMALRVGSGLPNIQKTAIDGVDIIFPLEDEQKSIGQFLSMLSNLITLHQRGKKHIGEIKNDKRNKTE